MVNLLAKDYNLLKNYQQLPVIILRSNPRDYCKTMTQIKVNYQLSLGRLIVGWAVPTNGIGQQRNLFAALPTDMN
ncbi:MAG: hypothetical protein F6K50_49000 [Moorea sp. SIO3I7]|nr:hypothetical protein [Moorena sp. SIO3I7]